MNNPDNNEHKNEFQDIISPAGKDQSLEEIRDLIVGPEKEQLADLRERLNKLKPDAAEIGDVLPEAVVISSKNDKRFSQAILPTVEEAIRISVARDSKFLADALYPVMGPSIRKAIFEALRQLHQAMNKALEKSFTWQGLKWRIESLRTGKSFTDIVLYHTLIYQVEQVFLIHKETGLVLNHLVAENSESQDADLVSSMLTAIQDFVHDSFKLQDGETLETMQVGELTVWVEHGAHAVLAGAIRGNPPEDLRTVFQEALEHIHLAYGSELISFEGDNSVFESSKDILKKCLLQVVKETHKRKLSLSWIVLVILACIIGYWGFSTVRSNRRWKSLLEKLNNEPGIVVTSAEKHRGKFYVNGIRDPLSAEPATFIQKSLLDSDKIIQSWDYYQALDPELLIARAEKILKPPSTVSLKLENDTLFASGEASHQWITEARLLARNLVSVTRYDDSSLIDTDMEKFNAIRKSIENQIFLFPIGDSRLLPGQEHEFEQFIAEMLKLTDIAESMNKEFLIQIKGHTDSTGPESRNTQLSQQRANTVFGYLISHGIDSRLITTTGVGSNEPVWEDDLYEHRKKNRRVSFKILAK
ncbi:MAG: OmpA family protein [Candidatus Latescibacteria bacterium]|nr:OmpA family protein [Candidatus Latescibacterota bacterium]